MIRRTSRPSSEPAAERRDDWRLVLASLAFVLAYGAVALRMGLLALAEPAEPQLARAGAESRPVRGEIHDRNGAVLAANLPAWSLYVRPAELDDPEGTAAALAAIFPDMTEAQLLDRLTRDSRFVWVKRPVTPRQKQAIMDLRPARPALRFGRRDMRIYPGGAVTAHIVGGVSARDERVVSAELVGRAGVERYFDARLRDPARAGEPVVLALDLGLQAALSEALGAGIARYGAKAGAAVLMDVRNGEIPALVSLPDFDPNAPITSPPGGAEDPRFNRAVQGRYELGSTFKVLTAAMALEAGVATPDTLIDTATPLVEAGWRIRDQHHMPAELTLTDVVVRSSNLGAARLAQRITTRRFRSYLKRLGLFDGTGLELAEAAAPLLPETWRELSTLTVAYGHGLAVSPVHLAAAYATLANGGRRVYPTLVKGAGALGERVVSERVSAQVLSILRQVVERGTGRRAAVPGYDIGGKTGTADKPDSGGYAEARVMAVFAAVFPVSDPAYVLLVMLDEPTDPASGKREASRTAAPVTRAAVRRLAPILGMRPRPIAGETGPAALLAGIAN